MTALLSDALVFFGITGDLAYRKIFPALQATMMDSPINEQHEAIRDEKARLLKAIHPLEPVNVVRGQYQGYRQEPGVASDSKVETFAAVKLSINTWRRSGFAQAGNSTRTGNPDRQSDSARRVPRR